MPEASTGAPTGDVARIGGGPSPLSGRPSGANLPRRRSCVATYLRTYGQGSHTREITHGVNLARKFELREPTLVHIGARVPAYVTRVLSSCQGDDRAAGVTYRT